MKKVKGLTNRIVAMLMSGMLVVGAVPGTVLASDIPDDVGQTSEIAAEIPEETETEDVSVETYSEDAVAQEEEAAEAQYYTVTLDANGGYFENEWDDALCGTVERAEVVEKHIPVGGNIAAVPMFTETDRDGQLIQTMAFAGWSLERDGELVAQAGEEYVPVDNYTLYAVWNTEDTSLGETAELELAEDNNEQTDAAQGAQEVEDAAGDTVMSEEGAVAGDTALEANTDPETENQQDIMSDQEMVSADEDIENNNEISSEASVSEEEAQPELNESTEEEETAKEDAANGVVSSGTCGDNLTWILDSAGTLTISGTGKMVDYDYQGGPWTKNLVKSIEIEQGVTSIGTSAFYECNNLTSATLADSVTHIGDFAFANCSKLCSVDISKATETIGFYAFNGCAELKNINIPEGIISIESSAFLGCRSLTEITIPKSLSSIEMWEFASCYSLNKVTIEDGVSIIKKGAFDSCRNLSSIIIPASVTDIWEEAFSGYPSTLIIYGVKGSYAEQYAIDNNIEFRALEQSGETRSCLVYFDPNGGYNYHQEPGDPMAQYVFSYDCICGSEYGVLLDSITPYRKGYNFLGWFTAKEGGTQITETSIVDYVDELTLYAHWEEGTYVVTFFWNDAFGTDWWNETEPVTVTYKGYSTYGTLITPIREGYSFVGWFTEEKDGIQVYEDSEIIFEDHYIYAHWAEDEVDDDNDGIPNGWELHGADIDGNGQIDIDFPSMGADYKVPDIFVEVDWMTGLRPDPSALNQVCRVFDEHGIHLHIDAGQDSFDYVTGEEWGTNGHGDEIDYEDVFDLGISNIHWEGTAGKHFHWNRWTTFRYCLFVNKYKINNDKKIKSSGYANNAPGQWFIVADVDGKYSAEGLVARTFMHELGHTLGLRHGGNENVNYKPNYLSVMNYLFQLDEDADLNYSEYCLPEIDENTVDESKGIGLSSCRTKWYTQNKLIGITLTNEEQAGYANAFAIDFNCDGSIKSGLSLDLNGDYQKTVLHESQKDWDHLTFKGGNIGSGAAIPSEIDIPVCSNPEWLEEMSLEEYEQMEENTEEYEDAVNKGTVIDSGTCGDNLTWTLDDKGTLTVSGTGDMFDYENSFGGPWKTHREEIKKIIIKYGVTSIGSHAFIHCSELGKLTIPGSVKTIGWRAFNNCKKLERLSIANGVTTIDREAFCFCESLKKLVIPDSVTSIGNYAFHGCKSLTGLTISKNVTSIGEYTFAFCESLIELLIPANVTAIGDNAFYNCKSLTDLTITPSVQSIGGSAFYNCVNLSSITIPGSVKTIGQNAFERGVSDDYEKRLIIYGDENSYAETFASNNGFIFIYLNAKPIDNAVITVPDQTYTGTVRVPALDVKVDGVSLTKEKDYLVKYSNNYQIGEAAVKIIGIKNYKGSAATTFRINKGIQQIYVSSSANTISMWETATVTITGAKWTTSFKSSDTSIATVDKQGVVTPVFPGKVTIIATANGNSNYEEASKSVTIEVKGVSIAKGTVENLFDKTWTGKAQTQNPKVKINGNLLNPGSDYTVSYKNNKDVGTATMTIKGKGFFGGSITRTFKINKASQSITAKAAASSVAVGKTTTVSITGNKGTKSYKSSNTTIATVTSAGKVTAKKVGTVKITATSAATSNYNSASKTVTIKVVPAATASLTAANQATGIKLTWKKVTGANGYKVYRGSTLIKTITSGSTVTFVDAKANTNGTKYTYKVVAKASTGDSTLSKSVAVYRVARPAISSVTNSASRKMTVKWGKNAKANGYQIQYSTDKTFKSGNKAVTVASASTVSKVIGSLTKGKTYYVRTRTYKTVGSAKYWSVWSAAKSVKISK